MPKELTHWHLAHRAAAALPGGALADAALAYPEHVLMGAVSHDTGYYALGDPAAKAVADRAHGAFGADSYDRFRALAAHRDALGDAGLAFGLGALTHLAADVVFHPLVFSWTGDADAEDPALKSGWLYRHQALETALDVHLEALWGPAPVRRYQALVPATGPSGAAAVEAFLGAPARGWIRSHATLQGLFHHRSARLLARLTAWGHRRRDGDWSAAFYGQVRRPQPEFQGALRWVDPVSGEESEATLSDLILRFDEKIAALAAEWQAAWAADRGPFVGEVGPALDTGVPCDRPQTKRHFLPVAFG